MFKYQVLFFLTRVMGHVVDFFEVLLGAVESFINRFNDFLYDAEDKAHDAALAAAQEFKSKVIAQLRENNKDNIFYCYQYEHEEKFRKAAALVVMAEVRHLIKE